MSYSAEEILLPVSFGKKEHLQMQEFISAQPMITSLFMQEISAK